MNKFTTLLFGLAIGAALMFVSLKYYVVRASDGFHMVPKTTANLSLIYSDIRDFTVDDWKKNKELMIDITKSDNVALQEEAAKSALGNTIEDAWTDWTNETP
jgi:hypothetical protein